MQLNCVPENSIRIFYYIKVNKNENKCMWGAAEAGDQLHVQDWSKASSGMKLLGRGISVDNSLLSI